MGEVKAVSIDPQVVDPEDVVETLQDLIVGAFADGHQKIGKLAGRKDRPTSQGLGGGSLGELFWLNFTTVVRALPAPRFQL